MSVFIYYKIGSHQLNLWLCQSRSPLEIDSATLHAVVNELGVPIPESSPT